MPHSKFQFTRKVLNWVDSWPGIIKWPILFYIASLLPDYIIGKRLRGIYNALERILTFYLLPIFSFMVIPHYFPNLPILHTDQFHIAIQVWHMALPLVTVYSVKTFFNDVLNGKVGLLLDIPLVAWAIYESSQIYPLMAKAGFHSGFPF